MTAISSASFKKDEGDEGEEQQCVVLAERIPRHRLHAFTFGYQIADISDLLDQSNHPFEPVLYLTDTLSAVTTTVAVGSANRDRIPSKPSTRQLVPP